jgi:hypothetical protein
MTDQYVRKEYPLSDVTARIIAAAKRVHGELGPGYRELIYQRALALELPIHGLEFSREVGIDVHYRGAKVGHKRVDFIEGKYWSRSRPKQRWRMWISCRRSHI